MDRGRRYTGEKRQKENGGLREGQESGRGGMLGEIYYAEENERTRAQALSELNALCTGRCARKLSLFFGPQR